MAAKRYAGRLLPDGLAVRGVLFYLSHVAQPGRYRPVRRAPMPAIRLQERRTAFAKWSGACPAGSCGTVFEVEADPWQGKISVLSALRHSPPYRRTLGQYERHVHGSFVVYEDPERGGE